MVVVTSRIPGMTQEQYEGMSEQMYPLIKGMPGFIAHAGMPVADGWQVIEFWQSREQFDTWYDGVVKGPATAAGLQPSFSFIEATAIVTP